MALIRWEPVPMNRLFNSFFDTQTVQSAAPARRFSPATDLIESETHFILRSDLPGVSEADVTVELNDNVLSISGERKAQSETTGRGYHRIERTSGSFRRSVRLPDGVDADAIQATFDRGVLEVSVPKPQAPRPHKVQINISSGNDTAPVIEQPAAPSPAGVETAEPAAA